MSEESKNEIMVIQPNVEAAVNTMHAFQQLKAKLLDPGDTVEISGKKYIKRSGWRKIALAFNISIQIVSVEREKVDDVYIVRVKARATAPNGRISEEVGVCDSSEFSGNIKSSYHNVEAKATTRAINRAISNLVGGGELSAEELITGSEESISQNHEAPRADDPAILIQKIKWGVNHDGSRFASINTPEAQALYAYLKPLGGKATINGKIYELTDNEKYIREKPIANKQGELF